MRRTHLIGAAVAVALLAVAVTAYAVPASQTTFELTASATSKKAGTSKKPKAKVLSIGIVGGTNPAGGVPSTSTDIEIQLPKTLKWMGAKWPGSKRCDAEAAEAKKSDSVCPKGSRVSLKSSLAPTEGKIRNHAVALVPHPKLGKLIEPIDLTAYVLKADSTRLEGQPSIKGGTLGLWLQARPTAPAKVSVMIPARITKKNTKIVVHIPDNVQEPSPDSPSGIDQLAVRIDGKVKVGKRTYGAISSVGCKNKRWKTVVSNVYRDGVKKKSDTSPCSPVKKKKEKK